MMRTFVDELTIAQQLGKIEDVDRLLDVQHGVKTECAARIASCNDSIANVVHQLDQLGRLIDNAREYEMNIENGDAPLLDLHNLICAVQDWRDR